MNTATEYLSTETLIAASPLLGHELEDRSPIRRQQDLDLVRACQSFSTTALHNDEQRNLFCVAPLDFLVSERNGTKEFHLLELNGTGIGGLTNMSEKAVSAVLDGMQHMAQQQLRRHEQPLILIASSGKESEENPRLNKLIYEKLMYAEAFKQGFESRGTNPVILTTPGLQADPKSMPAQGPVVVVGYIKEFLQALQSDGTGQLTLYGRPVTGMVNDRFCLNVLNQFSGEVDLTRLDTMNRCHLAGADKATAYRLLNEFLQESPMPHFPSQVHHAVAHSREELLQIVLDWRSRGLCPVIKPQGTGLGHGIEFFLSDEPQAAIEARIDRSIQLTQEYYQAKGGAFPYTVCEYVDACTVPDQTHPLFGHKYELRVVVYRDEMLLRAFPSIIKVACEPADTQGIEPAGLINNITASCMRTQAKGTDYMFPLANRETLRVFGLDENHLAAVCSAATQYVRYVLDQTQQNPTRLGLPARTINYPKLRATRTSSMIELHPA